MKPKTASNEVTTLSEIMCFRGITSCSGHCGNSLIKFSLWFYKLVLDGELDFAVFNKKVLAKDSIEFWRDLMDNMKNDE